MADNFTANAGAGGSTFASDDIGGIQYPRSKIVLGADGVNGGDVSASNPMPTSPTGAPVAYWPTYGAPTDSGAIGTAIDSGGALVTRGAILTDEGTFRANFANASLAVAIGSVTVSGLTVTGTGFSTTDVHWKDYFKLDADAESAWVQIASIDSDTQLTLVASYVGGASGAASRALVRPITGAGGSITVASGQALIASGTTSGSVSGIYRTVDYGPLVFRERLSVSQRVANQSIRPGMVDGVGATPKWFARFRLEGAVNTTLVCESGRNPTTVPSAAETESTTITVPFGLTTAALLDYRIEQLTESVRFYINGVLVADHSKSLPSAYDFMTAGTVIENTGVPSGSTTVTVDYLTVKNHNKLEVGIMSDTERVVAAAAPLQRFSYSQAGVITINTDLMVLDCLQLRSLFIQCTSMGTTGIVTVQWANDAAFTAPITATLLSEAGATSTTFNAAVLRVTNVMARYCRLRLTTATTAGTTTLSVWGAQTPYMPIITNQPISGSVSVAANAGTNLMGDVGQQYRGNATGAATTYKFASAATVNNILILTGARRLLGFILTNTTASFKYFRFYNKATAPTSGESPTFMFGIPPNTTVSYKLEGGIAMSLGLGIACTGAVADTDATVTAVADVIGAINYA